jgi:hypothetical protein
MKKSTLFILALIGSVVFSFANAIAGSAVALGPHNQLATAYGGQSGERSSVHWKMLGVNTAQTSEFSPRVMSPDMARSLLPDIRTAIGLSALRLVGAQPQRRILWQSSSA